MNINHFMLFFAHHSCLIKDNLSMNPITLRSLSDVVDGIAIVLSNDGLTFLVEYGFKNIMTYLD